MAWEWSSLPDAIQGISYMYIIFSAGNMFVSIEESVISRPQAPIYVEPSKRLLIVPIRGALLMELLSAVGNI